MTKPLICSDMDISPQLTGTSILQQDADYIKEVMTNGNSKN